MISLNSVLPRLLVTVALMLGTLKTAPAESKFSFASTPGQLPKNVVPRHYTINLKPDLKAFATKGSETIELDVKEATQTILLNFLEMRISKARLAGEAGQSARVSSDETSQIATLTFPEDVEAGRHKLELEFEGKIGPQVQGLYYEKYQTDHGERVLIATELEPTDARRVFPCWDEPAFRATFQLNVEVPQKWMAVSNMPVESEKTLGSEFKRVSFSRTPRMSSYLLVLVAGELEALTGEVDNIPIRIICTQGKKEKGEFALEVTKKLLSYYNDYFGLKYPLPKLDQIALPGGFGGAMENWGGIVYNESVLLFDPESSSQDTKETIFSFVSHEMAHLWFGDLVTMAWWDGTWLNEGFASWMSLKATDHFNPSWHVWERENESKNYAMESDARKTTHPIQLPVTRASEALNTFDEISYEKGAAVLRMLETYLGEDAFRQGIRDYLVAHQYSNTTSADLWEALKKASGKAVSDLAPGWIEQPGFPLVQVKSSCQNGTRNITLEQERFSVNDSNPKPLLWLIPVTVARIGSSQKVSTQLLATQSMTMPAGSCTTTVKLNAENVGYYRVQYTPAMFSELRDIAETKLSVADRLNLLSDTWALVEAERFSSVDYLNLVQALREDNHLAIWEEILGNLGFIDQLQIGQPGREAFQAYARSLLYPVFERVGWDSKPGEEKSVELMRSRLISTLGDFKEERIIAEAQRRFDEFLNNPASLPPDLRPPVVGIVGRYSGRVAYDQLHNLGRKTQSTEEKRLYYGAIARALDPKLAQETLQIALTDELPPTLNFTLFFSAAYGGEHRELAWEFTRQHRKELADKMSSWDQAFFVPGILKAFSESSKAEELEVYAKTNLPEESKQEVAKAAEDIRFKAKLKQRELPNIDQWVQSRAQSQ